MVGAAIEGSCSPACSASLAVNAAGEAGGCEPQLGRQAVLAVVGIAYPFVMTWIILWVVDRTVGLRVSPGEEEAGLGSQRHAEVGHRLAGAAADMASDSMAAAPGAPQATEPQ